MLRAIEGVYRNGKIELVESPPSELEGKVIVTFLNGGSVDLAARGIDAQHAAALRQRLKAFAEDWDRPEMDVTMPFSRADVVLVLYPDSNLRTAKRRPALVVQANNLQTGLPRVILAMISSNLARAGHSSRVPIALSSSEGQQMGLRTDSVVMTDNLATVFELEIERRLGHMPDMTAIDSALRHTLGLR
ncbi:MAG TPA: type II toxin-antitoxin system PemK/MazF family toxin [Lacipirellulaceae bacterium]